MRIKYFYILLVAIAALSACALIKPHYETPGVGLKSFRMVPGKTLRGHNPSAEYTFTAKIDTGGFLSPMTIEEKGRLPLFAGEKEEL